MAEVTIQRFVEEYINELEAHSAAVFVGAGFSAPAGFVDWRELLAPLASDMNLDIDREHDLLSLAQYHVTRSGNNRTDLNERILNQFSIRGTKESVNHQIMARLPIGTYWTTNYDTLIEGALQKVGKLADVKHSSDQMPHALRGRDATVYKMHGDVNHPHAAVITKSDYEMFHHTHAAFLTALAGDLISKTFLFVGFSFSDPNLSYVLGRLRLQFDTQMRKHYCVFRREQARTDDKPGDLQYRLNRQSLFLQDLQRYNVRAVVIESYDELTSMLRLLETKYKQRAVFVSGAAARYGAWPEHVAVEFVHSIGQLLVSRGYQVVSGLGVGVGSLVVDGALTEIYHHQKTMLKDQLVLRPFPQSISSHGLWTQYRHDMLNYAGIALFMFGNRLGADGEVVDSDGVREEFEIAVSKGVAVLPLGFTGFVALELWTRVSKDLDRYVPRATPRFKELFLMLGAGQRDPSEWLELVGQTLSEIKKGT